MPAPPFPARHSKSVLERFGVCTFYSTDCDHSWDLKAIHLYTVPPARRPS